MRTTIKIVVNGIGIYLASVEALLLWLVAKGTEHLASRPNFENFWLVVAGGVIATTVAFVLRALAPERSLREALV